MELGCTKLMNTTNLHILEIFTSMLDKLIDKFQEVLASKDRRHGALRIVGGLKKWGWGLMLINPNKYQKLDLSINRAFCQLLQE